MWLWIALSCFFSACCVGFGVLMVYGIRLMDELERSAFLGCTLCFGVCSAFLLLCLSNVFVIEVRFLHGGEVWFSLVPG